MALSRLENFIKNVEGNILYVNPDDLDSTDDINNQGNSLTRPFKTIQRALLEAARFSYQIGINNDIMIIRCTPVQLFQEFIILLKRCKGLKGLMPPATPTFRSRPP